MDKLVEDALARGKVLREELDKKKAEEDRMRQEQQRAKETQQKADLQAAADRYLSYLPEYLTKAVAQRKPTFVLVSYESEHAAEFRALYALIEPKLKEMELQCKYTTDTEYVIRSYDPETGYNATYYQLEVVVPEAGL